VRPQRVWFLSGFGLKMGIDFDHFGLKWGVLFTLVWHCLFCLQELFFRHQVCQICRPSQMFTQMEAFLVSRGHILEPRVNSWRSEMGHRFWGNGVFPSTGFFGLLYMRVLFHVSQINHIPYNLHEISEPEELVILFVQTMHYIVVKCKWITVLYFVFF